MLFGDTNNEEKKLSTPAELSTPKAQGYQNEAMNSAVKEAVAMAVAEAVKSVFAGLAPVLKDMQLTPEKMNELKQPYIDPLVKSREERENRNSRVQAEEQRKLDDLRKANCPHLDKSNNLALGLLRNFHDRNPRGVCMLCNDLIHPKEWRIGAPDEKTGETVAYLAPEHKDYGLVRRAISMIA
jgi:hypothetical protein